jgi:hypothetical protein
LPWATIPDRFNYSFEFFATVRSFNINQENSVHLARPVKPSFGVCLQVVKIFSETNLNNNAGSSLATQFKAAVWMLFARRASLVVKT